MFLCRSWAWYHKTERPEKAVYLHRVAHRKQRLLCEVFNAIVNPLVGIPVFVSCCGVRCSYCFFCFCLICMPTVRPCLIRSLKGYSERDVKVNTPRIQV